MTIQIKNFKEEAGAKISGVLATFDIVADIKLTFRGVDLPTTLTLRKCKVIRTKKGQIVPGAACFFEAEAGDKAWVPYYDIGAAAAAEWRTSLKEALRPFLRLEWHEAPTWEQLPIE